MAYPLDIWPKVCIPQAGGKGGSSYCISDADNFSQKFQDSDLFSIRY